MSSQGWEKNVSTIFIILAFIPVERNRKQLRMLNHKMGGGWVPYGLRGESQNSMAKE